MARKMVRNTIGSSSDQLTIYQRSALVIIPLSFICVFYFLPTFHLLGKVISVDAAIHTFQDPRMIEIIRFTFFQAVLSTFATLIAGLGPTWLVSRFEFKGRKGLVALISVPFMLPSVIVGSAFLAILPSPLHETTFAIILAHIFFEIAVIVRIVGTLWSHIPLDLEHASATLGASPRRTFMRITLPLLSPAIISACLIVFVLTFTSFGVIRILGGTSQRTIETEIARQALNLGDISTAGVLSIIQLIVLGITAAFSMYISKHWAHPLSEFQHRRHILNLQNKWILRSCIFLLTTAILTPLGAILHMSFRVGGSYSLYAWTHFREHAIRPGISTGVDPLDAIATTCIYMLCATTLSVLIGMLASLGITKLKKTSRMFESLIMLIPMTSSVTVGLGMLITFNRWPIDWRSSGWIIPVGHTIIALPFIIHILVPVLRSRPKGWADAAATLGATPMKILMTIDIAQLKKPLINVAGISAALSLGEFGATTLLSRSGHDTMPIAIAKLLARTGDIPHSQAYVLATILMIVTTVIVVCLEVRNA